MFGSSPAGEADALSGRMPDPPLVQVDAVSKAYREGGVATHVLRAVEPRARRGETTSLIGASGSGKSTLLGLHRRPDAARLGCRALRRPRTSPPSTTRRARELRADRIGIVLQSGNLIPFLTAARERRAGDRARRGTARGTRRAHGPARRARARPIGSTTSRAAFRWRGAARRGGHGPRQRARPPARRRGHGRARLARAPSRSWSHLRRVARPRPDRALRHPQRASWRRRAEHRLRLADGVVTTA